MIAKKFLSQLLWLPVLAAPLAALGAPAYKVAFAPAGFKIAGDSPTHLNNRGHIVGNSDGVPAVWHGSRVTTFAVPADHYAKGINNRGDIVGQSPTGPFVYTSLGLRYISMPIDPLMESGAIGVNDAGEVFGWSSWGNGGTARGFLHSRRGTQLIGTFGGDWSWAYGMNGAGHVVGYAQGPEGGQFEPAQAFLYKNGLMRNLGTLGGAESLARDINDAGQIVGYAELPKPPGGDEFEWGDIHAFLYQRGVMRDLGTLGGTYSSAHAINKDGVVVGAASLAEDTQRVAFVYENRKMTDLNTRVSLAPGWRLETALDINDKGQILAQACYLEDCNYWARLTPLRKLRHSLSEDGEELSETADAGDDE